VRELLFGSYDRIQKSSFDELYMFVCPILLAILTIGELYIVVSYGMAVTRNSGLSFLTIFILAYFGDIFLISPTKILVEFLLIDLSSFQFMNQLRTCIQIRARRILQRKSGFFNLLEYSLLQRMNPACRLARAKPALSVSKLLVCVNDCDFEVVTRKYRCYHLSYYKVIMAKLVECVMYVVFLLLNGSFLRLPTHVQRFFIDLLFTIVSLSCFYLATKNDFVIETLVAFSVALSLFVVISFARVVAAVAYKIYSHFRLICNNYNFVKAAVVPIDFDEDDEVNFLSSTEKNIIGNIYIYIF
jgi:hypothetical protein